MSTVIPRPAARAQAADDAILATEGPWEVRAADPMLDAVAVTVRELLAPHLTRIDAFAADHQGRTITLALGEVPPAPQPLGIAVGADESYRVTVTAEGVTCRGNTPEGVFRAATTVVQMIATETELPHQELTDAPRYAWRGLMVDPARSFVTPDELRRVVDVAALYKLNVLHLHLSDNE